jgi:hypothetical protein
VHADEPGQEYLPEEHVVHDVEDNEAENLPLAQGMAALAPVPQK